LQKSIISLIALFCAACSCLSDPVGKENEIIIISSPEDKPHVERILGNLFSQIIYTHNQNQNFLLYIKNHGNWIM